MTDPTTMSNRTHRRSILIVSLLAVTLSALTIAGAIYWSRRQARLFLDDVEQMQEARDYPAAREKIDSFLRERPNDPRALLLSARNARKTKDYYNARELLRASKEHGGDSEAIDIEEALIDVQRGEDRSIEWLRARSRSGDSHALAILEVLIQHDLDTYQLWLALDGLNLFLEQRPNDLQALMGRARVWERFLYFKDALADYQRAVEAHPDNEVARLKLADTLLLVGTPAEALQQYRWLEGRFPDKTEVRLGLARCLRQIGETARARGILNSLIQSPPENGEALWELGQMALEDGKPGEAEPLLRRAAKALPYDRRVIFSLQQCLADLKKDAEAAVMNARVQKIDADIRRLDQVRQEVMKKPDDPALRVEGGLLFLRNGERREGVRWLRHALKVNPGHRPAIEALREAEAAGDASPK